MMPISPVTKAATPQVPAISIGTVSRRLLKNVSPPRWPERTRIRNNAKNRMKAAIKPTDHLPQEVFGNTAIRTILS
jgi:hypothetical protein